MKHMVVILAMAVLTTAVSAGTGETDQVEKRASELLKQMTLEEKIDYIGGTGFSIRAVDRLGIPEIVMSDGPMGCRGFGKAAAFPGGIALAASWNPALADEVGAAMGRECRARGVHILLAPGVNIYRSPLCGRNFEYLGEDPFLSSNMVAPLIQGIQSQEVLATVKHYACNNQEWDRHSISSEVDERTLREIYLPAFKAAVQKGKTRCLMTAYNLINGVHASENDYLNNQILKGEWGFDGIIMSDWVSTYDAVGCANGGLDLEMPTGEMMNRKNLIPAIKEGKVKESTIDEKVMRILRTIIAAGFMDRPQKISSIPLDDPSSNRVALKGARESIVLLKNENGALPLNREKIKSVAVLGPNAHPAVYCGGGSAYTTAFRSVSILEGIKSVAGDAVDVYTPVQDLGFVNKAKMELYNNKELSGEPVKVSDVDHINFIWTTAAPDGIPSPNNFSVRWTGKIKPDQPGKYRLTTRYDDGIRVWLDGKLILDDWTDHLVRSTDEAMELEAREYDVKVEYYQGGGEAIIAFQWIPYVTLEETIRDLAKYDAVVYCAGFNNTSEGEGFDRPFELPKEQVEFIKALAEVHPRMIVTLNTGGGVAWDGWLDKVPAVIETWYSGQQLGRAAAEIIFGDVNPSGKLPATFEKRYKDNPTSPYYSINDDKNTPYGEGIFVGYRGYDRNKTEPQFCFGYGLSYTNFGFSNLKVQENGSGAARTISVTCDVTNTGTRAGAEVDQLYV
ncbi:MAG: glycoside hydrolase family 3 C-terminal domain-containing protein, partial [Armatimonadota bacterium]